MVCVVSLPDAGTRAGALGTGAPHLRRAAHGCAAAQPVASTTAGLLQGEPGIHWRRAVGHASFGIP